MNSQKNPTISKIWTRIVPQTVFIEEADRRTDRDKVLMHNPYISGQLPNIAENCLNWS